MVPYCTIKPYYNVEPFRPVVVYSVPAAASVQDVRLGQHFPGGDLATVVLTWELELDNAEV